MPPLTQRMNRLLAAWSAAWFGCAILLEVLFETSAGRIRIAGGQYLFFVLCLSIAIGFAALARGVQRRFRSVVSLSCSQSATRRDRPRNPLRNGAFC